MRVAIRTDASPRIGTGHVRRMLALAKALRDDGHDVRFVTRSLGVDSVGMIARHGFAGTVLLDPPDGATVADPDVPHADWAEVEAGRDAAETGAALAGFAPDWTVVDSYAFDARWHRAVREELGGRLAVIDDLADRAIAADIVVDHNFHPDHAAKYADRIGADTVLLAGPAYALLDPVYAAAPRYRFQPEVRSVGVFLGGVDYAGFSMEALDCLPEAGFSGPVEVVSTSANPQLPALEDKVARRPNTTLLVDLPDLSGFFARHDLQIGAGGGANWERCCIGAPTVALVCAENQRLSVPFLDAAGIVVGVDMLEDAPERRARLVAAIRRLLIEPGLRRDCHEAAMKLVDGRGAARISAHLAGKE